MINTAVTKENVRMRGVSALLEDREKLFNESEVKSAIKAAIFESRKKTSISINDLEEIANSAVAALKMGLAVIPKETLIV
jgi:hypothetical protein